MKKRILALALSMCIIFSYVAFLPFDATDNNSVAITASADNEGMGQYSNSRNYDNLSFEDAKYFYYNQLNDREKELYNKLKDESFIGFSIKISINEERSIKRAYAALLADFPIFKVYYNEYLELYTISGDDEHFNATVEKNPYGNDYNIEKVKATVKQVVSTVKSDDRYTTVRKLWDYTLRYTPYSPYGFAQGFGWTTDKMMYYDGCAIGTYAWGNAVCEGLSDSIKIVCNELKIPCLYICNGGHAWNIIEMDDGKWYCFDSSIAWAPDYINSTPIGDYYIQNLLIGFNDNGYWSGSTDGVNNHFITDPYLFDYDDMLEGKDVFIPEIALTQYVYKGENTDFSYTVVPSDFVEPEPTFVYELNEDSKTCTITDFYGKQEGDLTVTAIGEGAFYNCTGFDGELYLPETLKSLGMSAFLNCRNLKKVHYTDNIIEINDYAFVGCVSLSGKLDLPKKLEVLGDDVFFNCEELTGDIILPDTLKRLGEAFYGCKGFDGFLYLPDNVEWKEGLIAHTKINEIRLNKTNKRYAVYDGILYTKDKKKLIYCPTAKEGTVSFPDELEEIQPFAFLLCDKLTGDLIFPPNLRVIGGSAFDRSGFNGKIVFNDGLREIGISAFCAMHFSGNLIIPDSVTSIGSCAFSACEADCDRIKISKNINVIEGSTFRDASKNILEEIVIPEKVSSCNFSAFDGLQTKNFYLNNVDEIGNRAFVSTEYVIRDNGEYKYKQPVFHCKCDNQFSIDWCKSNDKDYVVEHEYIDTDLSADKKKKKIVKHTCKLCNYSYVETVHSFSDWNTTIEPTCNINGEEARVCSICAEKEKRVIYSEWHNFVETLIEPSCLIQGQKKYTCSKCGYSYSETISANLGHDYRDTVIAPTCITNGYTSHKCTRCGEEYIDNETDMISHKFGDWDIKSYDPKTGKSKLVRKCENCTHTETKTEKGIVQRYAGKGRFATAAEISKGTFKFAKTVVLAYGLNSADALAGVPLAAKYNAPILLTNTKTLPSETLTEIKRLGATNVIILGGEGAIGKEVENALKKEKITTKRIAGKTRFGTATAIAEQLTDTPEEIFFVYAFNFADALSASTVAAVKGAPIIYLKTNGELDADTAAYLAKVKGKVKRAYVIGGTGVISDDMMNKASKALGLDSVTRVAGANRYATCIEVNNKFKDVLTGNGICVAKGLDFPDALAGGVFAALKKMPLFLADGNIKDIQSQYLGDKDISNVYIFGGTGAVPDNLVEKIAKAS